MKLMIVDDSLAMRKIIQDLCDPYFEQIQECSNGFDAVELYKKFKPDYVVMDIKMPGMNGIEALKKIIADYPQAKTIIITQYRDKTIEKESINAGAIQFLLKDNLSELIKYFN